MGEREEETHPSTSNWLNYDEGGRKHSLIFCPTFFLKLVASRQLDLCPEQGLLSLRRKSFRFFFVRFLFILFHFPLQAHPRFSSSSSSSSSSSYTREARLALCGAHVDWVCTLEIGDRLMQSPAKGVYEVTREIGKALSFTSRLWRERHPPAPKVLLPFHLSLFIGVRLFLKI